MPTDRLIGAQRVVDLLRVMPHQQLVTFYHRTPEGTVWLDCSSMNPVGRRTLRGFAAGACGAPVVSVDLAHRSGCACWAKVRPLFAGASEEVLHAAEAFVGIVHELDTVAAAYIADEASPPDPSRRRAALTFLRRLVPTEVAR